MDSTCDSRSAELTVREQGAAQPAPEKPGQRRRNELARQHLWRNYTALALDGGLFMGGMAFVNATTLLPDFVRRLGAPRFLIALMPLLMMLGFRLMPVLTAHWMDSLRRYRRTLLAWGILQRAPFLVTGLILLLAAGSGDRVLMLAAVVLAPLVSGIAGGIPATGFQQVVRKQIPERRRSSLFALRMAMGAVIGIGAGLLADRVLGAWPGATGYGVLYLLAYVVLMGSWVSFATIREGAEPRRRGRAELKLSENLRRMPRLMVSDRGFRAYLIAQFFLNGQFILVPFIAIYARQSLDLPARFLGICLMVQSAGALAGNVLAAWAGDRFGSKRPMVLGAVAVLVLAVAASLANSEILFLGVFGLLGMAMSLTAVGSQALVLGVCPEHDKSTYLALAAMINTPAMFVAALIAAVIPPDSLTWLALAAGLCIVASLTALWFVPNPGQRAAAPERAAGYVRP